MKLLLILIFLLTPVMAHAEQLYNPYTSEWVTVPDQNSDNRWEQMHNARELKHNPYDNTWRYESPDAELEYNPYEDKWEYQR